MSISTNLVSALSSISVRVTGVTLDVCDTGPDQATVLSTQTTTINTVTNSNKETS